MLNGISLSVLSLASSLALAQAPAAQPATKPAAPVVKPDVQPKVKAQAADAGGPFHVVKTFEVGGEGGWDYLALDPDAKRLYVPRSKHVMVLDTETGATVGDIADTAGVHGVALATDLNKGFTSNGGSDSTTVFDLKTLKTLGTVKTGKNPDSILYDAFTKRVFTFNGRSSDATVINAEDLSVLETIALGGKPEFSVTDGAGHVFVNIEDTSEIVRIDSKTMKVEQRWSIKPGEEPSGLAIDAPHHRLFSVCHNKMMVVVDSETGKVLATPAIGDGVDGAAFDPIGFFALSSNGDGTMTVVSTAADKAKPDAMYKVVQNCPTATRARTMVIDPKSRKVYMPTAEFEAPVADENGKKGRPKMKPNTFKIIVVAPQ